MVWRKGALLILLCVLVVLPFEQIQPAIAYASIQLTNLELVVYLALVIAIPVVRWPNRFWLVSIVLFAVVGGVALVAASQAQDLRLALFATYRLAIGIGLAYACYCIVMTNNGKQNWLYVALLTGALIAAVLGAIEVFSNAPLSMLDVFRGRATTVGPFLRLTSTFDHANQTAMYLEALVPLALCLTLVLITRQQRVLAIVTAVVTLVLFSASVLALSRASVVTSLLLVGTLLFIAWRQQDRTALRVVGGFAAGMVLILSATFVLHPVWQLRLQSEGDDAWYRAQIQVPSKVAGDIGTQLSIPVSIVNEGLLTWSEALERPIRLGAHWYIQADDGLTLLANEPRWQFPVDVSPNEMQAWDVALQLPMEPGVYRLEWDVVQESVTWFSQKNGTVAVTDVIVTSSAQAQLETVTEVGAVAAAPAEQTLLPPIPHRRTLWKAAYLLWLEKPLIGIGFDNYRLQYGDVLAMEHFNDTIHTNNWYVELFVSLGLLGAMPFFVWLAVVLREIYLQVQRNVDWLQLGLAAGIVAFMLHGLLDYFLLFNGTAFLFWILVGLWSGRAAHSS